MTTPDPTDRLREAADALLDELDAADIGDQPLAGHYLQQARSRLRAALAAPAPDLLAAVEERWLARTEWDGNGKRAAWRCLVCGQYEKHRADATDYCPIAWVLALIESRSPAPDLLAAVAALIAAATAPGVTATPEALLNLGDAVIRVRFLIESLSTSRAADR